MFCRVTLLLLISFAAQAQQFTVCRTADGKAHFSNLPRSGLDSYCHTRFNYHEQLIRAQYGEMLQDFRDNARNGREQASLTSQEQGTAGDIWRDLHDNLDADQALENLYQIQQQNRDRVPVKTHLQSEKFQQLLDMQ